MKKILFISSTGGHLTELLQLSPLFSEYDYHIITEKTKSNMNLYNKYGKDHVDMLVYGTKSHLIPYLFKFTYNCINMEKKLSGLKLLLILLHQLKLEK